MSTHDEKMKQIKEYPELHMHYDLNELQRCCMINGAIDLMLLDLHPAMGYNGGQKCDVISGPCSCGAWY